MAGIHRPGAVFQPARFPGFEVVIATIWAD